MTHASVFSGIGGPEVAATMLGWENLFHCEINPFGRAVLDYWYPHSKSYDDITKTDFREWRGKVDVLTGGFPCQPFSYAGKRGGAQDDRYLWPHMHRCINEVRPRWVVAENVAGILTMVEQGEVTDMASQATLFGEADSLRGYQLRETFTLQRICDDLESNGYTVQPVLIPACAVGAPHRRDRVFIVARRCDAPDPRSNGGQTEDLRRESRGRTSDGKDVEQPKSVFDSRSGTIADTCSGGQSAPEQQGDRAGQTIQRETGIEPFDGTCRPRTPRNPTDPDNEGLERNGGQELQGTERGQESSEHSSIGSARHAPHSNSYRRCEMDEHMESELADGAKPVSNGRQRNVANTVPRNCYGYEWMSDGEIRKRAQHISEGIGTEDCGEYRVGERWRDFPSVSPVHRGNDGLPFPVDDLTIPFGKWRTESLKAYGNAIVVQVMYEIFRAIEQTEREMQK